MAVSYNIGIKVVSEDTEVLRKTIQLINEELKDYPWVRPSRNPIPESPLALAVEGGPRIKRFREIWRVLMGDDGLKRIAADASIYMIIKSTSGIYNFFNYKEGELTEYDYSSGFDQKIILEYEGNLDKITKELRKLSVYPDHYFIAKVLDKKPVLVYSPTGCLPNNSGGKCYLELYTKADRYSEKAADTVISFLNSIDPDVKFNPNSKKENTMSTYIIDVLSSPNPTYGTGGIHVKDFQEIRCTLTDLSVRLNGNITERGVQQYVLTCHTPIHLAGVTEKLSTLLSQTSLDYTFKVTDAAGESMQCAKNGGVNQANPLSGYPQQDCWPIYGGYQQPAPLPQDAYSALRGMDPYAKSGRLLQQGLLPAATYHVKENPWGLSSDSYNLLESLMASKEDYKEDYDNLILALTCEKRHLYLKLRSKLAESLTEKAGLSTTWINGVYVYLNGRFNVQLAYNGIQLELAGNGDYLWVIPEGIDVENMVVILKAIIEVQNPPAEPFSEDLE